MFSCSKKTNHKEEYVYYDTGELWTKYEIRISDSLIDGLVTKYYKSGNIQSIIEWKNGKKNGIGKHYYENGQIEEILSFKEDSIHGKMQTYYKSGKIKSVGNIVNGYLLGDYIEFYENGGIKMKMHGAKIEKKQTNFGKVEWDSLGKITHSSNMVEANYERDTIKLSDKFKIKLIPVFPEPKNVDSIFVAYKITDKNYSGSELFHKYESSKGNEIEISVSPDSLGQNYFNGIVICYKKILDDNSWKKTIPIYFCYPYFVKN